jgi:xanthine dehydrogenase YagT iron-sulfur-binding subunit
MQAVMLLPIGVPAPAFYVADNCGHAYASSGFEGRPLIIVLSPSRPDGRHAGCQELTLEHETIPVLSVADDVLARQFGVESQSAVFMIDSAGIIRWRQSAINGGVAALRENDSSHLSRRDFLASLLAASLVMAMTPRQASAAPAMAAAIDTTRAFQAVDVTLEVNGRSTRLTLDPRVTLLDALREQLHLAGTKKGCDHGQCGACTVHVDGRRVLSCLTLAAAASGKRITTIEGLAQADQLHPIQQAFIDHDGFQCGYCTSGQIMSAVALLDEPCGAGDDDVRECMSGNICRCGAYPGIVAAVQAVRGQRTG